MMKKMEDALTEPRLVRWTLIIISFVFVGFFLIIPLVSVFLEAFQKGIEAYFQAIKEPDTLFSIKLTVLTAVVSVVLNMLFGISAAWAITRFEFPGKSLLITLIDLPFAVSPVISGMVFVLLFGLHGYFGEWLKEHDIKIIFATPGII